MFFPFLSKPAANPTGFLKVRPNRFLSSFLSLIVNVFCVIGLTSGIFKSSSSDQSEK